MDTAVLGGIADVAADLPTVAAAAIGLSATIFGIGLLWRKARSWAR